MVSFFSPTATTKLEGAKDISDDGEARGDDNEQNQQRQQRTKPAIRGRKNLLLLWRKSKQGRFKGGFLLLFSFIY